MNDDPGCRVIVSSLQGAPAGAAIAGGLVVLAVAAKLLKIARIRRRVRRCERTVRGQARR